MQLRQALEDALATNPDDLAAHSAYADWLSESSDPADVTRGEFIQVQLALERPDADRPALESRQNTLIREHGHAWLGETLASYLIERRSDDVPSYYALRNRGEFRFARGWLNTLEINYLSHALAAALAGAAAARLLHTLEIDLFVDDSAECHRILAGSPYLGNLRNLYLTAEESRGHSGGEGAGEFIRQLPHLESLRLMVHDVDTDTLFGLRTLTRLRRLQVYHLNHYPLDILAANPALGRLTELRLQPHALFPGDTQAYITLAGVRALVNSPHLRSLTHLEIRLSDLGDEGCAVIVDSGILARLEELTLSSGCISDAGARLLAGSPEIKHLRQLDLDNNLLTKEGIRALRAAGVNLSADNQRDPDLEESDTEDENHYLVMEGDWE